MNMKKWFAWLLTVCMILTAIPAAGMVSAETDGSVDIWDGTADTSWYDPADVKSEYHFTTAEQLAGLAELVGADSPVAFSKDIVFYLDNDLYLNDLSDVANWATNPPANNWKPIGDSRANNRFKGSFDGQNHTIYGMYCNYDESATGNQGSGLFGVSKEGYVQNIHLKNAMVVTNGTKMTSSVIGFKTNGGTVTNITSDAKIIATADRLDTQVSQVGGIVGLLSNAGCTVTDCSFTGSIDYTASVTQNVVYMGGIMGVAEDRLTANGCFNAGTLNAGGNNAQVGGIVGRVQGGTQDKKFIFSRCYNTGTIIGGTGYTGGLLGYNNDTTSTMDECANFGTVTAHENNTAAVGGLFGTAKGKMNNLYNTGTVSNPGTGYAAGVGGYVNSGGTSIQKVYNTGAVSGNGSVAALFNINGLGTASNYYYLTGTAPVGTVSVADASQNDTKWAATAHADVATLSAAVIENIGDVFEADIYGINGGAPVFAWQNAAYAENVRPLDISVTNSDAVVVAADTAGKYNLTWNANVVWGEELDLELINEQATFTEYGVIYGTSEDAVKAAAEAGESTATAKIKAFDQGGNIDVYTIFGFRLKNVAGNANRVAMFYVTYEVNGVSFTAYSSAVSAQAVAEIA